MKNAAVLCHVPHDLLNPFYLWYACLRDHFDADPFISIVYGVPIPIATVPHLGTKYGPEMDFGQRVHFGVRS